MIISPFRNVQAPQRYSLIPRPSPLAPALVDLLGRRKGVLPFFIGLFGVKSTVRLVVTDEEVNCETKSFSGSSLEMIPIDRVADVRVAEYRQLPKLLAGVFLMLFSAPGFSIETNQWETMIALLVAIFGAALVVLYFVERRLLIAIVSESGLPISIILQAGKVRNRHFGLSELVDIQRTIRMLAATHRDGTRENDSERSRMSDIGMEDGTPDEDADVTEEPDMSWEPPVVAVPRQPSPLEIEQTARRLFDEARRFAKAGDRDRAVGLLQELVEAYPQTTPADQARKNLAKIGVRE